MHTERLDHLLTELQALPARPTGDHLSEEEYVAFVLEALTADQEERVDAHLATCADCTEDLDAFFTAAKTFPQAQWAQQRPAFLQQLRARLQGAGALVPPAAVPLRDRVRTALHQAAADFARLVGGPSPKLAAPPATGSRPLWAWHSADGLLQGRAVEERNGDWTFRFETQELALDHVRLTFSLGTLRRPVVLQRLSPTDVGATVVVRRHERPAAGPELTLEIDETPSPA